MNDKEIGLYVMVNLWILKAWNFYITKFTNLQL